MQEEKGKLLLSENSRIRSEILTDACKRTNTDLTMSTIDIIFSGSTLVAVLLFGDTVTCANVGDSRAILGSRYRFDQNENFIWKPRPISHDHKPDSPKEYKRIINSNGRVESYLDSEGAPMGPKRVWKKYEDIPGLAMSRALGDKAASEAGVICIPEIIEERLTENDKIIVMGSDGIWEHLSNERVLEIVSEFWETNDPSGACEKLVSTAVNEWEENSGDIVDDITAIVIFLN